MNKKEEFAFNFVLVEETSSPCRLSELLEKGDHNLIIFPAQVAEERWTLPFGGENTLIVIDSPKGGIQ